jgi:hypothetical protein
MTHLDKGLGNSGGPKMSSKAGAKQVVRIRKPPAGLAVKTLPEFFWAQKTGQKTRVQNYCQCFYLCGQTLQKNARIKSLLTLW